MKTKLLLYKKYLLVILFLWLQGITFANTILYVDASKSPGTSQDGTTWQKAYPTLKEAIEFANANLQIEEIHVATGTYYPTGLQSGTNRDASFGIYRIGYAILGGFPTGGGERNPRIYETILSGEIGNPNTTNDNSRHVVVFAGLAVGYKQAKLDGLKIRWGRATGDNSFSYNGHSLENGRGGGIAMINNTEAFNIRITGCEISGNWAANVGAGAYVMNSNPRFLNNLINGNYANYGGGFFSYGTTDFWIVNCTIAGNHSNNDGGGGIRSSGSNSRPMVANSIIYGNTGGSVKFVDGGGFTAESSLLEDLFLYDLMNNNLPKETDPLFENLVKDITEPTILGNYRLKSQSPCIDKGINYKIQLIAPTDLDFINRAICDPDMGAYEFDQTAKSIVEPVNLELCTSSNTTLKFEASYAKTYQWQIKIGSEEFTAIEDTGGYSGSKTNTLSISSVDVSLNNFQYRCVVTGKCDDELISNVVHIKVNDLPKIINSHPSFTACLNEQPLLGVEATGASTYRWQINMGSGYLNISDINGFDGASTNRLAVPKVTSSMNGYKFRCIVTGICGSPVTSAETIITVDYSTKIFTTQPVERSLCLGGTTTMSVLATPGATQYYWYVDRNDGQNFQPVKVAYLDWMQNYENPESATLTIKNMTAAMNGYKYQCRVSYLCETIVSNPAQVTFTPNLSVTKHPSNSAVCNIGGNTFFSITASNVLAYQWQVNRGSGFVDITNQSPYSGTQTNKLRIGEVESAMNGYQFRCRVTDQCDNTVLTGIGQMSISASNHIRYVKQGALGTGLSWNDASGDLQKMIDETCEDTQIWLAKGVYKPTENLGNSTGNSNKSFLLKKGVSLYGGFAGTESTLAERNLSNTANQSILSGDLDNSGSYSVDDAYHVLVVIGDMGSAVLDGLTITGGNAAAGGVVKVKDKDIVQNKGGGLYIIASSLVIRNMTFSRNFANVYGGGIYSDISNTKIQGSMFTGNSARDGGGMYNFNSQTNIENALFSGNHAVSTGGAVHNYTESSSNFTNVTFAGNRADYLGGAIFNNKKSIVKLNSSILWGNSSDLVHYDSSGEVDYTLGQTNWPGSNNISLNPMFISSPNYAAAPFVGGDYRLEPCSPALNMGNPIIISGEDLLRTVRVQSGRVDMGAYEMSNTAIGNMSLVSVASLEFSGYQNPTGTTWYAKDCNNLILGLTSSGDAPIQGPVKIKIWNNSAPGFVNRHYEITPETNTENATGIVTLYFTQSDFDAYNSSSFYKLPTNSIDDIGKSNLRIRKKSGVSSDNSGQPNTYTGFGIEIDPTDTDIVWNVDLLRWEVSFSVTGFSGFFLYSTDNALPVTLQTFTAKPEENHVKINWQTTEELNASHFIIERSKDAKIWKALTSLHADGNRTGIRVYEFVDSAPHADINYYRLRMVDLDESYALSRVISVNMDTPSPMDVVLYPNPVQNRTMYVKVLGGAGLPEISIYNVLGMNMNVRLVSNSQKGYELDMSHFVEGLYVMSVHNGSENIVKTFIVDH